MTPQISIQLYSVREQAAANYEATIQRIADMGFPCIEPAGFPGSSPAEAAKLFQTLGLKAPSCHDGLPVGDEKNRVIEDALTIGAEVIFTSGPHGIDTLDAAKALAENYCEAAANAAQHGLQVGYHNHDWDLCLIGDTRAHKIFLENTPDTILWEADTFWIAKAGLDPVAFLNDIGPRGKVLHFKDGIIDDSLQEGEPPFRPAGAGQVDLIAASKAATHAKYIAVEIDALAGDMMNAVQESYTWLTGKGIASGNK